MVETHTLYSIIYSRNMAKNKKEPEYFGGRVKLLVEEAADILRSDPDVDNERLHAILSVRFNGYGRKDACFNCGRSMKITEYEADLLDALLIISMAKKVRVNVQRGMNFTEANKVHLPTLEVTQGITKRNTKCDYLGLVKQPDNWRGTGYWLLTSWAWKALRGGEIPRSVKYWEGRLIERSEDTTTLTEMFKRHSDLVEAAIAKRNTVRRDHRAIFEGYDPAQWAEFGGYVQQQELL